MDGPTVAVGYFYATRSWDDSNCWPWSRQSRWLPELPITMPKLPSRVTLPTVCSYGDSHCNWLAGAARIVQNMHRRRYSIPTVQVYGILPRLWGLQWPKRHWRVNYFFQDQMIFFARRLCSPSYWRVSFLAFYHPIEHGPWSNHREAPQVQISVATVVEPPPLQLNQHQLRTKIRMMIIIIISNKW